jgi:hypothetical protein
MKKITQFLFFLLALPLTPFAQQVKISELSTCIIKESRQLNIPVTDIDIEKRWSSISNIIDTTYVPWNVNGSLSTQTSATSIKNRKWQLVRIILVFKNTGLKEDTIKLCTKDFICPNLNLKTADGSVFQPIESITSGMFENADHLKEAMKSHAQGIYLQKQIKGDLYVILAPQQRTWVALLFERPANISKCSLKVFDKILPLKITP